MKLLYGLTFTTLLSLSAGPALAAVCADGSCDIRWKMTSKNAIELSTVCYNYRGTQDYRGCRKLAKMSFQKRCDIAKKTNDSYNTNLFCRALERYVP